MQRKELASMWQSKTMVWIRTKHAHYNRSPHLHDTSDKIHNEFVNSALRSCEDPFCYSVDFNLPIYSQFCTCHDNSDVVACTKSCLDLFNILRKNTRICLYVYIICSRWINRCFMKLYFYQPLYLSGVEGKLHSNIEAETKTDAIS